MNAAYVTAGAAAAGALGSYLSSRSQNRKAEEMSEAELAAELAARNQATALDESSLDPYRQQQQQAAGIRSLDELERGAYTPVQLTGFTGNYRTSNPMPSTGGYSYTKSPELVASAAALKSSIMANQSAPTMTNPANYGLNAGMNLGPDGRPVTTAPGSGRPNGAAGGVVGPNAAGNLGAQTTPASLFAPSMQPTPSNGAVRPGMAGPSTANPGLITTAPDGRPLSRQEIVAANGASTRMNERGLIMPAGNGRLSPRDAATNRSIAAGDTQLTAGGRTGSGNSFYAAPGQAAANGGYAEGFDSSIENIMDDYGARGGSTGGAWSGAARGAAQGAMSTWGTGVGVVPGAAIGAIAGGIHGAATKHAQTAPTDFRVDDARMAIGRAFQQYQGRGATRQEIDELLAAQGWQPDHQYVGQEGLTAMLAGVRDGALSPARA